MGIARRLVLAVLLTTCAWAASARAEELRAKQLFDDGVRAVAAGRTATACALFEASLAEADRPATRFNLALANSQLGRPLEVARHALALRAGDARALPPDAVQRTQELLDAAQRELAILDTSALPAEDVLRIDGSAALVVHAARVYVTPGRHRLELTHADQTTSVELELAADQITPWPQPVAAEPQDAVPLTVARDASADARLPVAAPVPPGAEAARTGPRLRRTLSLSTAALGTALSLSAWACYIRVERVGSDLSRRDPMGEGFVSDASAYWRLQRAILPIAFTGGVLMAAAVAVRERELSSFGWALSAVAAAGVVLTAGAVLLARSPEPLIEQTEYREPSRQLGGLLVSSGLPLLTYGIRGLVRHRRR
jgi:hypothetical protein